MLGAVLLNFLINGSHRRGGIWSRLQLRMQRYLTAPPKFRHFLAWLGISVALGALSAAVSLPYYMAHAASYKHPQVVIPVYVAIPVAAALSTLAVGIALILMPTPIGEHMRSELAGQGRPGPRAVRTDPYGVAGMGGRPRSVRRHSRYLDFRRGYPFPEHPGVLITVQRRRAVR